MKKNSLLTMKSTFFLLLCLIVCLGLAACGGDASAPQPEQEQGVEISLFAAASLTDAMNEIIALYEEDSANTVAANYGSSGTLATQIVEGAACDIFFSAATSKMDVVEEAGMVVEGTRADRLVNTLTLIASKEAVDKVSGIESLLDEDITVIAMGEPTDVPAGQYAMEALTNLGYADALQSRLLYGKDVRAVLDYVATGNAEAGFVYRTDAVLESAQDTIVIVGDVDPTSYTTVTYPLAMIADPEASAEDVARSEAAHTFYEFLTAQEAADILTRYGFTVL